MIKNISMVIPCPTFKMRYNKIGIHATFGGCRPITSVKFCNFHNLIKALLTKVHCYKLYESIFAKVKKLWGVSYFSVTFLYEPPF